jgi:site-specific recombinase XerD
MKLSEVVSVYVSHKRFLGHRFRSEGAILKAFCKTTGDGTITGVNAEAVLAFLGGSAPITGYWIKKYHVLSGFYRFAAARRLVNGSPLPRCIPPASDPPFVPYIYSDAELKRLLANAPAACAGRAPIEGYVFRAVLLVLYGAGLRIGEALSLAMADVDLEEATLRIRETKFFKTRIVPLGRDLTKVMVEYVALRNRQHPATPDAPFFCFRSGLPLSHSAADSAFRRLRACAGIQREGGPRRQPRLHDLRHSAAVHRLVAWYRTGADLQDLLPKLSTYLGHVDLSSTQRYLTMTPELLREASLRFERYVTEENHV